jgi:predicted GNAT family acetyltransferase
VTTDLDDQIRHDAAQQRFSLKLGDARAVLDYARVDASTLDYRHTFVPPSIRGRGIASALTAYALRYARDENLKVIPSCPFVAAFVQRHPEHKPVVRRG